MYCRSALLCFSFAFLFGCSGTEPGEDTATTNGSIQVAGTTYQTGNIRFEIVGAEDRSQGDGEGTFLLKATFTNLDKDKRITSPQWAKNVSIDAGDDISEKVKEMKPATIEDEHGNVYYGFMSEFPKPVMPEKTVENDISFTELVPTAKALKVTLVGNEYTGGKDLVFSLQRDSLE